MRISDWSSDVCSSDLAPDRDAAARVRTGDRRDIRRPGTRWGAALAPGRRRGHADPRGRRRIATTRDGRKLTVLLAIDVGNTNAKFALFRGEELLARWRIATDDRRTADEYMRSEEHTSELQSLMRS